MKLVSPDDPILKQPLPTFTDDSQLKDYGYKVDKNYLMICLTLYQKLVV